MTKQTVFLCLLLTGCQFLAISQTPTKQNTRPAIRHDTVFVTKPVSGTVFSDSLEKALILLADSARSYLAPKKENARLEKGTDLTSKIIGLIVALIGIPTLLTGAWAAIKTLGEKKGSAEQVTADQKSLSLDVNLKTSAVQNFFQKWKIGGSIAIVLAGAAVFFFGPTLAGLLQTVVFLVIGLLALAILALKVLLDHKEFFLDQMNKETPSYEVYYIKEGASPSEKVEALLLENYLALKELIRQTDDHSIPAQIFVQLEKGAAGARLKTFVKCTDPVTRSFLEEVTASYTRNQNQQWEAAP
jgi:hypothetical protein